MTHQKQFDKKFKAIRLMVVDKRRLYTLLKELRHHLWYDNLNDAYMILEEMIKVMKRSKKYNDKDFKLNMEELAEAVENELENVRRYKNY